MNSEAFRNVVPVEVESQYSENTAMKKIPKSILDKYLTVGDNVIFKYSNLAIEKVQPVWVTSWKQFVENMKGVFMGNWKFDENKSVYWAIWGPISLLFFSYILHSSPFQNKFLLYSAAFIDLAVILLSAFALFVYCNILHFPHNQYLQHVCVSSHIGLLTMLHVSINLAGPKIMIIPMSFVYIGICFWLHFSIYNIAIKPTLLQFIILILIILCIYGVSAYLLYFTLLQPGHSFEKSQPSTSNHFTSRSYIL